MHTPHVVSGGRYPVLRALAIMYVIGAGLIGLAALLIAAYTLVATRYAWLDRMIITAATLAGGFIVVVTSLAMAELLKLFIDIEHNTRMSMPGRIGMPASTAPTMAAAGANNDGGVAATTAAGVNRITALDEETAEAALMRGH